MMMPAATNLARRGLQRCAAVRSKSTNAKPDQSFLDSAFSNLSALRWRIASSLTESLSKEEQKELLSRLNIPQSVEAEKENEEEDTARSIREAVAAAKAEEAQKQTAKWEREKGKLMAEAEEATKQRVENELAIQHRQLQFQKWQQQLEAEKEEEKQTEADTDVPSEAQATKIIEDDHPVLGPKLTDLGYKRVHLASVQVLTSLPVWKKQRTYRHNRAKSMAEDKMKTLHLGMPGVIALHEDKNGQLSIVDGQHRVGMMQILEEKKEKAKNGDAFFDLDHVLVEVYPEPSSAEEKNVQDEDGESSHAQEIFLEINKAEPVKLVDLPGIALTKADRKTINEGAKRLADAYPKMFSPSQRCRAPHLNIDNLRDALFKSDAVKRHSLKSPKAMETWMLQHNERLKEAFASETKAASVSKTALQKAIKYDFYLGLDSTWLLA